jgi:hypothetical protein
MSATIRMLLGPEWHCFALTPRVTPPSGVRFQTPVLAFRTPQEREEAIAKGYTANLARTHMIRRSKPIRARSVRSACERYAFEVAATSPLVGHTA